jgi:hypothetical protein
MRWLLAGELAAAVCAAELAAATTAEAAVAAHACVLRTLVDAAEALGADDCGDVVACPRPAKHPCRCMEAPLAEAVASPRSVQLA